MNLQQIYAGQPQAAALAKTLADATVRRIFLQGMVASAAPVFFSGMAQRHPQTTLFVLQDADEAGYFYQDLVQLMGQNDVLFFPSSYRRAVKYGQRDAANEILRTEVLARLAAERPTYVVCAPDALSELVVSKQRLDERTLRLSVGQTIDTVQMVKTLRSFDFREVDYVYEPGQFAVRGSIVDIYSYSHELPFRIDFFGDEIDTIRTFDVENQLSKDKREAVEIVPELARQANEKVSFLTLLPHDALLVMKDFGYVRDTIERIYDEGFAHQALEAQLDGTTEVEQQQIRTAMQKELQLLTANQFAHDAAAFRHVYIGSKPTDEVQATITFNFSVQPLFHKNFDLLRQTLEDYQLQGYRLVLLADSKKQQERLRDILSAEQKSAAPLEMEVAGDFTLHAGYVDNDLRICFFTDHQIFDRFHKYNLKSDHARAGKLALTMKELQEMEPGDFIVHVDFGIGKFGGLVRVPTGNSYQEMIRIVYQNNDKVDVSIHSLYKISRYRKGTATEQPRLST